MAGWAGGSPWDQIHRNEGVRGVRGAAGAEILWEVEPEGGVPAGGAVQQGGGALELLQPQISVQPGATMETLRVSPSNMKQQIYRLPSPQALAAPPHPPPPLGFATLAAKEHSAPRSPSLPAPLARSKSPRSMRGRLYHGNRCGACW